MIVLEIFSLDVKRYDQTQKFIFYVSTKEEKDDIQVKFHELNWSILERVSEHNKYIRLGRTKV